MKRMLLLCLCLSTWLMAMPAGAQAPTPEARLDEVEKRLDAALAEISRLQTGGGSLDTASFRSRLGFAPAASKVYGVASGLSIGGYGEMLLEKADRRRENGRASCRERV